VWALCASGLRNNSTHSEPVGIYWAVGKELGKGNFVFALPPAEPVFALAKERGYLGQGPSSAGTSGLIKQVAALPGYRVTINDDGVWVHIQRPKDNDWTADYGWIRGPIWGREDGRPTWAPGALSSDQLGTGWSSGSECGGSQKAALPFRQKQ
jgi:hypothetical protein